jgi:uncharacterized membrane protein
MRRLVAAISLLSFAGLVDSGYLVYLKIQLSRQGLGCSFGGCDVVNQSQFATLLGVPVALWGFISYALLLAISLLLYDATGVVRRRLLIAVAVLSGWGVAFSAYLTAVEIFILDAICPFCVVSALLISAVFFLSVAALVTRKPGSLAG